MCIRDRTYFSSVAGIGMGLLNIAAGVGTVYPVSYTHLDVYKRQGGMISVPTWVVYFVNHFCVHGVLFDSANAMAAVLIFLLVRCV